MSPNEYAANDGRHPIGHLNYPGNVVPGIADAVATGRAYGPNDHGERMFPVDAAYDPEANRTRVGFSLIPPTPKDTP